MPEKSWKPDMINHGLNTRFIGQNVLFFPSVSSTMDVARKEAMNNAQEGTAVLAERQTAGRGRLKRKWHTPEGNIAVSIILYPPKDYLNSLIMLASLAVLHSIQIVTGLTCNLKWPNDVLIHKKKVCGILIETRTQIDRLQYAVFGIGINVNMAMYNSPELKDIATSLSDEIGKPISRIQLLQQLFKELERSYLDMLSGISLFPEWSSNLITIGKLVRVQSGDDIFEGTAELANEDGSLLLRLSNGSMQRITIGDVSLHE